MESWSLTWLLSVFCLLFQFSKEKYNRNDDPTGNPKGMIKRNLFVLSSIELCFYMSVYVKSSLQAIFIYHFLTGFLSFIFLKPFSACCPLKSVDTKHHPANIYLFKLNNRNTRKRCEICSKLTIKTPDDVIDVVLVFLLLTLNIFHTFF